MAKAIKSYIDIIKAHCENRGYSSMNVKGVLRVDISSGVCNNISLIIQRVSQTSDIRVGLSTSKSVKDYLDLTVIDIMDPKFFPTLDVIIRNHSWMKNILIGKHHNDIQPT